MSEKSKKSEKKAKTEKSEKKAKVSKAEKKERKPMRFRRDHLKVVGLLAKELPKRPFVKITAIAKLFKDGDKITADRIARNSVRKPVSEGIVERGEGEDRGCYRLSASGAAFAKDMDEYEAAPDRGEGGKKTKGKKSEKKALKKSGKAKPAAKPEKAPKKKADKKDKKAKAEKKAEKDSDGGLDLPTDEDERPETSEAESGAAESPESESSEESPEESAEAAS